MGVQKGRHNFCNHNVFQQTTLIPLKIMMHITRTIAMKLIKPHCYQWNGWCKVPIWCLFSKIGTRYAHENNLLTYPFSSNSLSDSLLSMPSKHKLNDELYSILVSFSWWRLLTRAMLQLILKCGKLKHRSRTFDQLNKRFDIILIWRTVGGYHCFVYAALALCSNWTV